MKKFLASALSAALLLSALAGCSGSGSGSASGSAPAGSGASNGDKVVKIGVFEPASGDSASGGKKEMLGMQFANSETPTVELGGETYQVELVYADNGSSTDKAPSAASQLVSEGVSVVLGSYGSGVSIAAGPIFRDAGIPAMGVTCTNPNVTAGNDHYFRICFLDPFQGTVLANFAHGDLSAKKAYCLSKQGDDYSAGVCNYFKEAFTKLGGEVVEEAFPDGNSDFTSYVTNAKNQGCDVFFAPVSIEAAANIIKQAQAQGLEIPMLASDTWDSNVVAEAAKGTGMDIYVTTFYQEGGSPDFDSGIKEYINSDSTAMANNGGNDQLAAVSAMGYDAYFTALEALKAAGSTDSEKVKEALPSVSYTGVTGTITFGENGDANRTSAFIKKCNTETAAWDLVREQGVE